MINKSSSIMHSNLRYYLLCNFYNPVILSFSDKGTYIARTRSINVTEYDVKHSYLDIIKAMKKNLLE